MKCELCGKDCIQLSKHLYHAHKFNKLDKQNYFDTYIEPNDIHMCPWCNNKRKFFRMDYERTCGKPECKFKQIHHTSYLRYGNSCACASDQGKKTFIGKEKTEI